MHINRIQHLLNDALTKPEKHDKLSAVLSNWKNLKPEIRGPFTNLYALPIEEYAFKVREIDPENLIVNLNKEIGAMQKALIAKQYNEDSEDTILDILKQLCEYREQLRTKLLKGEKVELI